MEEQSKWIHMNDLHTHDMGLTHNGLVGKVKSRSYEVDTKYEMLEVKKCCSLTWLSLSN